MAVNNGDRIRVCDRNLVRLDANEFAVLCVCIVDGHVTTAETALVQIPEVGELGEERTGDILNGPVAHVREDEEQQRQGQQGPRCEEQGQEHGAGCLSFCLS